jgi:protein kinase-like protein
VTTTAATTIGAALGAGPVATVYSGLYEGMPVALKVFPGKAARRALSVFEREQNKLRTKGVPSVVPVHGVEQLADGRTAVRMELCTQSLAALVRRVGRLEPSAVIVLGHSAAMALAASHAAGVVHGGVTPNNVLFRATGEPLLSDFGVTLRHAFARDPLQSVESLPPETLRDDILDQRTDLYGLGVVLHVALTGRWPHPGRLGEHLGERVLRVLGEPVPAINLPGVSVELTTVVARLLAADPAHRPSDAGAVAGQLGSMLSSRPSSHAVFPMAAGRPLPARPVAPRTMPPAPNPDDTVVLPAVDAPPRLGMPPTGSVARAQSAMPNAGVPAASAPPPFQQGFSPAGGQPPAPSVAAGPPPVAAQPSGPMIGAPPLGVGMPPQQGIPTPSSGLVAPVPSAPAAQPSGPMAGAPPQQGVPTSISGVVATVSSAGAAQSSGPMIGAPPLGAAMPNAGGPTTFSATAGPSSGAVQPSGPMTGASPSVAAVTSAGVPTTSSAEPARQGTPMAGDGTTPAATPQQGPAAADMPPSPSVPLYSRLSAGAPPADQAAADLTVPAGRRPRPSSETEDDFDDFAAVRNEPHQPVFPDEDDDEDDDIPHRLGWGAGEPPPQDRKRVTKYYLAAGAGAVVILVVIAVIMVLQADPPELATTPQPPPVAAGGASPAPPAVQIDLQEPDVRGNQVVLTWTSNPEKLDFAVVVTRADEPGKAVVVPNRAHTLTVPIDDVSAYCFQVQASNSDPTDRLYQSQARPIRGSDCHH